MSENIVYEYIGDGATLEGIPGKDLTEADVDALRSRNIAVILLVRSGLYKKARKARSSSSGSDVKKTDDKKSESKEN